MSQSLPRVSLLIVLLVVLPWAGLLGPARAADSDTPWLDGVDIPPVPTTPTPTFDANVSLAGGAPVPATMTEDVPVLFEVQSPIFDAPPPTTFKETPLPNAQWSGNVSVDWHFNDMDKNRSTIASTGQTLPGNQMTVTPLNPCGFGAVTVFLSRGLRYEEEPGSFRLIYATAGRGQDVKVLDITPPLCGMEVGIDNRKGTFWTVENPPNHHPLPKFGDVMVKGEVFAADGQDTEATVSHLELGPKTTVAPEAAAVTVSAKGTLTLAPVVQDNDKVDDGSIRFGVCELNAGVPAVIGAENPKTVDVSTLDAKKKLYLFVEAKDASGNPGSVFFPLQIK